jgi:glycosyltransferase involved in cell wall biosynthesis
VKISIITVSFNSAQTIEDTLKSVATQSYKNIEHIIVDGASTDMTMEIVKREGEHLAKIVSEPDNGIFDAMNRGLDLATGDVIGFLNSDDMFAHPDSLAAIAHGFLDGLVDAVYGDLVFVNPKKIERVVRFWRPGQHVSGACAKGWMAPHPTFYVRRNVLVRNGGFDTNYKLQSDFDLMLRLFEKEQIKNRYLPEVLVRMRLGGATTGSIRNIIKGNLEAARACRKAGFPGGIFFITRKIFRRFPQFFSRPRRLNNVGRND